MSAFAYREPYRLSAGVLTVLAHVLFFALLYLGVNWHFESPQGMQVDLWASLPEPEAAPPAAPVIPPQAEPKPEPVRQKEAEAAAPPAKADIELAQKKKKPAPKPEPKKALSKAQKEQANREMQAQLKAEEQAEQKAQAARETQAAARAAQAEQAAQARAAITSEVDKYKGLIGSKIRRYVVVPPDVPDDAVAEFVVMLLPDGSLVANPKLVKSSGNAAYDAAVERAILAAEPLPLPKDEEARKQFINPTPLKLKFSPKDGQ